MDDPGQLTPPAPEPQPDPTGSSVPTPSLPVTPAAPSWWSRWHRLVIAAAAVLVVLGVAVTALALVLKPAPNVERMVPATSDVYGMVNLDPSVAQKVNLMQAVHRFPATSSDQKISDLLDKALKDSGLSYSNDLKPWLGSSAGFAVKLPSNLGGTSLNAITSTDATWALYAASKDDARAQAFLASFRAGKFEAKTKGTSVRTSPAPKVNVPSEYTWQDRSYDGITISVGTSKANGSPYAAYAIVDRVVVITTTEAFMREIIDTAHGRAARLVDTAQYKATLAQLPADRIAVGYLNGKNLAARVKDAARTPLAAGFGGLTSLNELDAFQGAAVVFSARSDGVVADVAVRIDSSKLSASTRSAISHAGTPTRVISWIPASSDAFLAFGNLRETIQSLLDQAGTEPSVKDSTDQIGLTGPHGVLSHLTGDFAAEFEINHSYVPAGAILIGTDNTAAMQTFFAGILTLAIGSSGDQIKPTTTSYRGVAITTLTVPSLGPVNLFAPSYAVIDGMGVIASNTTELKAIIDAHKDQSGIDHEGTYAAATAASLPKPGSVFFVNIGRLVDTLKSAPATSPVGGLNVKGSENLTPLRAMIITSSSGSEGFLERFVLFIE